jgi:hypothetical protein
LVGGSADWSGWHCAGLEVAGRVQGELAGQLDIMLDDHHASLDGVLVFTVGTEELIGRLLQRARQQGHVTDRMHTAIARLRR